LGDVKKLRLLLGAKGTGKSTITPPLDLPVLVVRGKSWPLSFDASRMKARMLQ